MQNEAEHAIASSIFPPNGSGASSPSTLVDITPPEPASPHVESVTNNRNGSVPPAFPPHLSLPHEALLLIFRFLHEQDTSYITPCMLVCRSWRKLIINESSFWSRLTLALHLPETAKEKALRYVSRCSRVANSSSPGSSSPAPQSGYGLDTGQPPPSLLSSTHQLARRASAKSLSDLSFVYLDARSFNSKEAKQAFKARLASAVNAILHAVEDHLQELRSLSIQIVGDGAKLVEMAHYILLLQITRAIPSSAGNYKESTRLCNARHISLELPRIHGLPLAHHCLAYFEGAESITIRGNRPLLDDAADIPRMPDLPEAVGRVLYLQAAKKPLPTLPENLIVQCNRYEAARRRYEAERADHEIYWRLEGLDWSLFHHPCMHYASKPATATEAAVPSSWGNRIDAKTCHLFKNLKTLNLFGCIISNNLVLPKDGFPSLRNLTVENCKWGMGLWKFLGASPNIEHLDIQYLTWNNPDVGEELVQELEDDDGGDEQTSPASTLSDDEETASTLSERTASQTSDTLADEDTPPYTGFMSSNTPRGEPCYILRNSSITILGEDTSAIYDFDEELENEDVDAAYNHIIDLMSEWSKQEAYYNYPEEICYPPKIDTGSFWSVLTKPICRKSWKYMASFVYHHRVTTHFDDRPSFEEDFVSEYSWTDLQKRRQAVRQEENDINREVDDTDPDWRLAREAERKAPPTVILNGVQSFRFSGGTFQPIWANAQSTIHVLPTHPAIHMPNVKQISLSGDRSLSSTRLARPLAEVHMRALAYQDHQSIWSEGNFYKRPAYIPSEDYDDALHNFEEENAILPGEPTDEELFQMMSEDQIRYYMQKPWKLHEYRNGWRVSQGLFTEDGIADERALLALITGASQVEPLPFAAAALMATSPRITSLDLSHTNISPIMFQCMIKYLRQLRELCLSGLSSLRDKDLEALPYSCPRLVFLDISSCGMSLTARGAAFVVDGIKHSGHNTSRLSKIKVDDPSTLIWPVKYANIRLPEFTGYLYLEFLGLLVDEEVELWQQSLRGGAPFSKKPGKQRMGAKYA